MRLSRALFEKLSVAGAVVLLVVSGLTAWARNQRFHKEIVPRSVASADHVYREIAYKAQAPNLPWARPDPQRGADGWNYDLFTPPVIYYDEAARAFVLSPPVSEMEVSSVTFPEWELVEVKRALFRVQLAGYLGSEGHYRAAFSTPKDSAETILAKPGDRLESLGLVLKDVEVKKIPVPHDDPWPVFEIRAVALLRDERAGRDVTLTTHEPTYADSLVAVIRFGADQAVREVSEGDLISDEGRACRIERIGLIPEEVEIVVSDLSARESLRRIIRARSATSLAAISP